MEGLLTAPALPALHGGLALVPLFPLLGAALCGLLGLRLQRRFGPGVIHGIAISAMLAAAAAACAACAALFARPAEARVLHQRLWTLVDVEPLRVDFAFALDPLSAMMILVITLIGTLIHVYATGYMKGDGAEWRFFALLNLFVFSMLLLVLGDSLLLLFFGWEGVGLCSYLLIGFWYTDPEKAAAGRKAFVTNRVGDWGFVAALLLLFWGLGGVWSEGRHPLGLSAGAATESDARDGAARSAAGDQAGGLRLGPTLTIREIAAQLAAEDEAGHKVVAEALVQQRMWGLPLVFLIGLGLFLGVAGKSAQLPLHVWLPDAMAGPTPVSALIHAATMVTAGVYLVARLSFLFALSPGAMALLATAGALTALVGAVIATFQTDLKRVLAYSTVSQLGFMVLAVGTGAHWVGIFHLVTHACFKACLFLAAGSVIHGMHAALHAGVQGGDEPAGRRRFDPREGADPRDPQDMRNMGGLRASMPRTRLAYLAGCLAIAGLPVASGFYSKDEILWKAFTHSGAPVPGPLLYAVGLLTAGLTSFYMYRSYYLTFWGRPTPPAVQVHLHESPPSMTLVLLALGAASIAVGPLLGWPEAWGGHPALERILAPVFAQAAPLVRFAETGPATPYLLQLAGVAIALAGWWGARALYRDAARSTPARERLRYRWDAAHRFAYGRLYFDELYGAVVLRPVLAASRALAGFDVRVVDGLVAAAARFGRALARGAGFFDRLVVDGAVQAVGALVSAGGRRVVRLQTGRINSYVFGIAVGVALLLAFTWFIG